MNIDVSPDRMVPFAPAQAPRDRIAASKPAAPAAVPHEVDTQALDDAIAAANQSMQRSATNVQFQQDSDNGKIVVRVIDTDTKQVLRQFPSEEMIAISKALDRLQGLMVHQKA